jgi:beta-galactosidase
VPKEQRGKDLVLDLATIMGADETYFNGQLVGKTGSFPPGFADFWSNIYQTQRSYPVPATLVNDTDNVVAVRVYCPDANVAGMYDAMAPVSRVGPFDPGASLGGINIGHTVGGIGWYRKKFLTEAHDAGRCVTLRLDGVYQDSSVWINGKFLGNHPYGYTGFAYDLTAHLNPAGMENTIAVKVNNVGSNSRWYSGSGIYRHTWISVTDPVHIAMWGVYVTTPEISNALAKVKVVTSVKNTLNRDCAVNVRVRLLGADGSLVAESTTPAKVPAATSSGDYGNANVEQVLTVTNPKLWSIGNPALYQAEVEVERGGSTCDKTTTTFGIRSLQIDAKNGLRLNGKAIKLHGGCIHHDNGPLGACAVDRAEFRKVELLKEHGYNAIRSAHNPPSPALLDAADRLGMLVIDEAFDQWSVKKMPYDYHRFFKDWWQHDIDAMVLRDGNHPSVIIWSIGNEIPEEYTADGVAEAKMLADYVRKLDPTRPVTAAANNVGSHADPFFAALDIAGYNYAPDHFLADHSRVPDRVMLTTESTAYHRHDYWQVVETMPWVLGDFLWTAWDYIGESGIGHANVDTDLQSYLSPWPWHLANCGDFDICGFQRPQSHYRDVVWGRSKLEVAVHTPLKKGQSEVLACWGFPNETQSWTWPGHEGEIMQVTVYHRYPTVRLLLNGSEIGEKVVPGDSKWSTVFGTAHPGVDGKLEAKFAGEQYLPNHRMMSTTFAVPYAPGELKVIGVGNNGQEEARVLKTAGAPVRLRLSPDRGTIHSSRDDLSYVTVEAVDAAGNLVPHANMRVQFAIKGEARVAGVGNADPLDTDSFQASSRRLFGGRALVILQPLSAAKPTETVQLEATAHGLASARAVITLQ